MKTRKHLNFTARFHLNVFLNIYFFTNMQNNYEFKTINTKKKYFRNFELLFTICLKYGLKLHYLSSHK